MNQIRRDGLESESSGVRLMDGSHLIVELQIHPSRPQRLTLWLGEHSPTTRGRMVFDVTSVGNVISGKTACDAAHDFLESKRVAVRSAAQALGA